LIQLIVSADLNPWPVADLDDWNPHFANQARFIRCQQTQWRAQIRGSQFCTGVTSFKPPQIDAVTGSNEQQRILNCLEVWAHYGIAPPPAIELKAHLSSDPRISWG